MSDYIQPDVLSLILKPLPIETILQCRCVCKSWKDAIDSRAFVVDHLALQRPRLIAQTEDFKYLVIDPEDDPVFDRLYGPDGFETETDLYVVSTAHGVICLYDNANTLLLWNPSIGRQMNVPLPETDHYPNGFKDCGFWIDPYTNEFKVVLFYFRDGKIAVFSSRTRKWTERDMESEHDLSHKMGSVDPQILIQGVGYWRWHVLSENEVIVCFDFVQERFGTIEFPKLERLEGVEYWDRVLKWRDCVSVARWQYYYPRECDLWALRDGSWSKVLSFNLNEPTAVLYVGDDFEEVVTQPFAGPMVLFDPVPDAELVWNLFVECEYEMSGYVSWVNDFVESLVFPDGSACIPA